MEGAGERSSHITGAPGTGPSITAIVVSKRAFSAQPFHPLLQQLGTFCESGMSTCTKASAAVTAPRMMTRMLCDGDTRT